MDDFIRKFELKDNMIMEKQSKIEDLLTKVELKDRKIETLTATCEERSRQVQKLSMLVKKHKDEYSCSSEELEIIQTVIAKLARKNQDQAYTKSLAEVSQDKYLNSLIGTTYFF